MVAKNSAYLGGGVALLGSSASLHAKRCVIEDNRVTGAGSGLSFLTADGLVSVLDECMVRNNSGGTNGALYIDSGNLEIAGCNITDNDSRGVTFTGDNAYLIMRSCLIENNQAAFQGGGLIITGGINSTADIIDCTFRGNRALQGAGIFNAGTLTLNATSLTENNATSTDEFAGGALYNVGDMALVNGCLLSDNHAPPGLGQTLYNGGSMTYVLPAPLGYYMTSVFRCERRLCQDAGGTLKPCKKQGCDYERFPGMHLASIPQGHIETPYLPLQCAEGYFGNSSATVDQTTYSCAGKCQGEKACSSNPRTSCEVCASCEDPNANYNSATKMCHCNRWYFHAPWSQAQCFSTLFMIFGWGLPGWASLLFLPVCALRSCRPKKRPGTRTGRVYAALKSIDTSENERRYKALLSSKAQHSGVHPLVEALQRLRLTARIMIILSALSFPSLPSMLAFKVFWPYSVMQLGAFSPQLRRPRAFAEL